MKTLLVCRDTGGHNSSYVRSLSLLMECEVIFLDKKTIRNFMFLIRPKVLFTTIDNCLLIFALWCLLRTLFGMKTAGICLMPYNNRGDKFRRRLRQICLLFIKKFTRGEIISIIPSYIHPDVGKYSSCWIYDPEFWDMPEHWNTHNGSVDNPIIGMVGVMNADKNLGQLIHIVRKTDFKVKLGGIVRDSADETVSCLERLGAHIKNTKLTNDEMLELYTTCSHGWAAYTERYDMSSGVVGRCIQLGVVPIVRKGSIICKLLEAEGLRYQLVETISMERCTADLSRLSTLGRMRDFSISQIYKAL